MIGKIISLSKIADPRGNLSVAEQMKDIPFPTVFIHGLVRDDKGRKMYKSLGNGHDPLEMAYDLSLIHL